MKTVRDLKFKYSPAAAEKWIELQDRFPGGQVSGAAKTVFYAVVRSDPDDLKTGDLRIAGYRVTQIAGYPTEAYLCCYDNNNKNRIGLIFRIRTKQKLFVVEELYEGDEAPPPVAARYVA